MKWFTRIFSVLLCLCLVLGAVPTALGEDAAFEQYEWPDDKLRGAVEKSLKSSIGWAFLFLNLNIDDVATLRKEVTYLDLTDCGYTELPDLSVFESLRTLILDGNPITNLDALNGNTKLTTLSIIDTPIKELPNLPELTNLYATQSSITSFDSIAKPASLKVLTLGSPEQKLTPQELALLDECGASLQTLGLYVSSIDSLSFLNHMPSLSVLELNFTDTVEMEDDSKAIISALPLKGLYLYNVTLKDIDFLKDQTSLRSLLLSNCQISDISVVANMSVLSFLYVGFNPIKDISAVENLSALESFYAPSCEISDLTPLSKCKILQVLSVGRNQIESVDALSKITSLRGIDLSENKIENVKPLTKLKSVYDLRLACNQITDPTPLAKLKLTNLELYDNPLDEKKLAAYKGDVIYTGTREEYERLDMPFESDCEPLVDALKAEVSTATYRDARDAKRIDLQDAALTDFPDMSAFKNLTSMLLAGNSFTSLPADVTGLATLSIGAFDHPLTQAELDFIVQNEGLTNVTLNASGFTNLDPLASLKSLWQLVIRANKDSNAPVDLTPLSKLKKLTSLYLDGCALNTDTLKPLVKKLTNLFVSGNPLTEEGIADIGKCTKLTSLTIIGCGISDISGLSKLKKLTSLNLMNNQIADISALAKLTKLVHLSLLDNQITDITPLAKLTKLLDLNLLDNQITDITPLAKLKKLQGINLNGNAVSDVSPIYKLKNLTTLTLKENPVAAPSEVQETFPFAVLN